MSEMVERVARAIRWTNENTEGLTFTELSEAMARRAIEAMRNPTLAMRKVSDFETCEIQWPAMIDAALAEDCP